MLGMLALAVGLVAGATYLVVGSVSEVRVGRITRTEGADGSTRADRWSGLRELRGLPSRVGPAARRRGAAERLRVVQALAALAAELESGQPPRDALRRSGGEPCVWPLARGALHLDGDVASALQSDARRHPVLGHLAACWRVAADSGAGLAASVARLAAASRAAEDIRVDLEAQLAGPRATARLLALLPLVGIGFGILMGADPIAWLLGTAPGRGCLIGGVGLTLAGIWWTGRIATRVERLL